MNNEDTLFADALAITCPRERRAFLDRSCGSDVELRARLEELLGAHDRAGSFLESPAVGVPTRGAGLTAAAAGERPGAMVGPYKLLEQIGEGGMGAVFMAEQVHPVRRRVALKIIKPGMDTRRVIARFEAERQALAMMDHPNIARVLEAGATDSGRPYFVMELVRGAPITEYCDQHQLSPRQRLELFVRVCQAVQHAHQKGIIHRDLKPNNVLVTVADDGEPVPKVIDFGIAKATIGQRLTEQTLFTEFRQLVGTPLYMSPEQAEMSAVHDVDTRSDVYSLGVLAYELLTGTTPFDKQRLGMAAYDEVRRIIREEEPPRPSTRLSTLGNTLTAVSAQRHTDPKRLTAFVRGELDWIVMRALEKDRGRRYATASGFAQDVERYLADQPVEACPPSRVYRVRKFARRNKAAIATTSLIAAVLVAATAVSTWAAVRAKRAERQIAHERDQVVAEKQRADELAAIANAINDFLNKDVLGQANVEHQSGGTAIPDRDVRVRDLLDRAAAGIADRFANRPLVEAAVRDTLGDAYVVLGEFKKAEGHLEVALRIRSQLLGDVHADTRQTVEHLGSLYINSGQSAKAEALLVPALQRQRQTLGARHRDTLRTMAALGALYAQEGRNLFEAERLLREAIEGQRAVLGEAHEGTLITSHELAVLYEVRGDDEKAEHLFQEILKAEREQHREHRRLSMITRHALGALYTEHGLLEKAEPLLLEALDDARRLDGGRSVTGAMDALAELYEAKGDHAKAERLAIDALEDARRQFGEHDWAATAALYRLGSTYANQRQFEKAEPILLKCLEEIRAGHGRGGDEFEQTLNELGLLYFFRGQYDRAMPCLEQTLELMRQRFGENHNDVRAVLGNLADALKARALWYRRQGRSAEADADVAALEQLGISGAPRALGIRAALYKRLGRFADALADENRVVKLDPSNRVAWQDVAALSLYLGHETEYRAAREVLISRFAQNKEDHPAKHCLLAPLQDAEAHAVMAMIDRALSSGANAFTLQYYHGAKGMAEYRCRNYGEALKWLKLSRDALTKTIGARPQDRARFIWDEARATDDFFIAMSQYRLGNHEQARVTLAMAQDELRTTVPLASSESRKLEILDWLMVHIIEREATRMIRADGPAPLPATYPSTTRPGPATTKPAP